MATLRTDLFELNLIEAAADDGTIVEFTGATAQELITIAPQHKETIERLAVAANHQTQMPEGFSQ